MKALSRAFLILVFGILYIPMAVLVLFSFNASKSTGSFTGFSFRWYIELFSSPATFEALGNTLILAVSASVIATVIGTLAALGIHKMKNKYLKSTVMSVTNIPMMNPDIVTGISMMLLFVFVGGLISSGDYLSFWTMLIAHVTFSLPYVILSVLPKLRQMDKHLPEAAMDLGCTSFQAFYKVELHTILPGIVTGMMMAFTLSLDDFVISFFTAGSEFQTLPLLIYSMTKKDVSPDMYALSTIMMAVIFALMIAINLKGEKKPREKKKFFTKKKAVITSGVAVGLVGVILFGFLSGNSGEAPIVLNVYNWGEYISDGSEGSLDANAEFEAYCKENGLNVKVNYTTFDSNESLYNKLKSGAVSYDIVVPSEYMIARMAKEGMLEKINVSNIPNYQYIYDNFKTLYGEQYDENNVYYVPYFCGYVGIIYNTAYVDPEDVEAESWNILWNEKYEGKILQFNNSRDAFGTVLYKNGIDVNTTDHSVWRSALEELRAQKPLIQSYVMDEIFNKMKNESAYIAPYYAGDFLAMYEENDNLAFYFPKEGTNVFVDGMCIPKGSDNKEIAEMYINFMLTKEIATANAEMTYYSTPNKLVNENPDYVDSMTEVHENAMEYLDPVFSEDYVQTYYENLDDETLLYINTLWEELKIDTATGNGVYIACIVVAVLIAALLTLRAIVKHRRRKYY